MNKKKILITLSIVLTIVLALAGSTFAYWEWFTGDEQGTNVVFTLEQDFSCAADGGGNITSEQVELAPASCTNSDHAIMREITVTPTIERSGLTINMDLWLDINEIGSGLSNSDNFKYAVTTSNSSCTDGIVTSGSITAGQTMILSKNYGSTTQEKYYLWVWLDSTETSSDTMHQTFDLSLGGECYDYVVAPSPSLDSGMVPVTIANNGTVTTVAPEDDNWYDYTSHRWANVVLVTDENRDYYLDNLSENVAVSKDDILAYYVWIPRYSYKMISNKPHSIRIRFESVDDDISNGDAVNTYYTHPAFTWDGEPVAGIWVGKFETSADKSSTCYTSSLSSKVTNCNVVIQSPRVLPNVYSLRYQYIGNQFATSQAFSAINNPYGLSNATTDAHMMKNSEWGAVAYLSHSIYGINQEVRLNNSSYMITGCGASTVNAVMSQYCQIGYGQATSYPQSTTGNISGIFDMSGGAFDAVMGNYNNTSHSTYFPILPDSKYYDVYTQNQFTSCTLFACGGHALNETSGWYGDDLNNYMHGSYPWFLRGGAYNYGKRAGIFFQQYFDGFDGGMTGSLYSSFRSVLVVGI